MSVNPQLMHILMELRYKPTLALYSIMDKIGADYAESYADWQRSAMTLELRDKKKHRRAFFSHRRAFFETIGFKTDHPEYEQAEKSLRDCIEI